MQLIEYSINKQIITQSCPRRETIAGSDGHVFARFTFDEEWDGLAVTVFFQNENVLDPVPVIWAGEDVEVPPGVLVDGTLRVSAVGLAYKSDDLVRLTTKYMPIGIRIRRSGPTEGTAEADKDPALWEQTLAIIGPVSELDTEDKSSLVAAINEVRKTGGSGSSAANMIVKTNADTQKASRTAGEIYEHVQSGGIAVLLHDGLYYDLSISVPERAYFETTRLSGNSLNGFIVSVDAEGTYMEKHEVYTSGTMVVTAAGSPVLTATKLPNEINDYVNTGGDAIFLYENVRYYLKSVTETTARFDRNAIEIDAAGGHGVYIDGFTIEADGRVFRSADRYVPALDNTLTQKDIAAEAEATGLALRTKITAPSGATEGQALEVAGYDAATGEMLVVAKDKTDVNPVKATSDMTQPVGVDADGRLYTNGYSRAEIDAIMGSYIHDINALIGGDV